MLASVLIAQERDELRIGEERNLLGQIYGVQVRHQRDRVPVMTGDSVVAAQNHALLAHLSTAQNERRVRANTIEIDGDVSGTGEGSVVAVRLLQEKSRACAGIDCTHRQQQTKHCEATTKTHTG